jgi:uncharacterized protein (UPF0128 family)
MGWTCGAYCERGEVHVRFWWENLTEGEHLEEMRVDGRIILKRILKKWNGGMEWVDLVQDRGRWRVF